MLVRMADDSFTQIESQLLISIAKVDRPLAVYEIEPWLLPGLEKLIKQGIVVNLRFPDIGGILVPTDKVRCKTLFVIQETEWLELDTQARDFYMATNPIESGSHTNHGYSKMTEIVNKYMEYLGGLPDIAEVLLRGFQPANVLTFTLAKNWQSLEKLKQERNELVLEVWKRRDDMDRCEVALVETDSEKEAVGELEEKRAGLATTLEKAQIDLQRLKAKLASVAAPFATGEKPTACN